MSAIENVNVTPTLQPLTIRDLLVSNSSSLTNRSRSDPEIVSMPETTMEDDAFEGRDFLVYKGVARPIQLNYPGDWSFRHGAGPEQFRFVPYYFKRDIGTYLYHLQHSVLKEQSDCVTCWNDDRTAQLFAPACGHVVCHICKFKQIRDNNFKCPTCQNHIEIYYHVHRNFLM